MTTAVGSMAVGPWANPAGPDRSCSFISDPGDEPGEPGAPKFLPALLGSTERLVVPHGSTGSTASTAGTTRWAQREGRKIASHGKLRPLPEAKAQLPTMCRSVDLGNPRGSTAHATLRRSKSEDFAGEQVRAQRLGLRSQGASRQPVGRAIESPFADYRDGMHVLLRPPSPDVATESSAAASRASNSSRRDDRQLGGAADAPPVGSGEDTAAAVEGAEGRWNMLVADRFCEMEAEQAAAVQQIMEDMQHRVTARLQEEFGMQPPPQQQPQGARSPADDPEERGAEGQELLETLWAGNGSSEDKDERAKIQARRRARGQHQMAFGASLDADVTHSDLTASTQQEFQRLIQEFGESERGIHWRIFVDGVQADNHAQLELVQDDARAAAKRQATWAQGMSKRKVEQSGLVAAATAEAASAKLRRAMKMRTGELRLEIAKEHAASATAARITSSVENERAATAKNDRRERIEREEELRLVRLRMITLTERLRSQKKRLSEMQQEEQAKQAALLAKERRLAILDGIAGTATRRPEEAQREAAARALQFQQEMMASRKARMVLGMRAAHKVR